ncbi:DUF2169 domain-containing protein [Pendulispora rubella]|uniref:DUF2169 domain-containing protein n=1 Tax=Pendulispora rubella TaxID=2741070 RepID=A0ABZ2L002_9BACT
MLWRTAFGEDDMAAAVVARITYRIVEGRLVMDHEQPWIIAQGGPWESPAGMTLPPDDCFRRGGIDLLVLGSARAQYDQPAQKVEVRAWLGDFVGGVDVFGERAWVKSLGGGLVPTNPVPFVQMPLTIGGAYGGKQVWDQLEMGFPMNPDGKGWYFDERNALHQPLPNIENPRQLIRRFEDQPDPVGVGFAPMGFGPTLRRAVELDAHGMLQKLHGTFFNQAFPELIAPLGASEGMVCGVTGVHPQGAIQFHLPSCPLVTDIQIGPTRVERPLAVDQIGIEPELGRVFITYRYPFRYTVTRMQRRTCVLRWARGAS